jgi:hypothetical protein
MKKMITLATSAMLLTAVGCSDSFYGSSHNGSRSTQNQTPQNEEEEAQGYYIAQLSKLNDGVDGNASTGTAYVRVVGDDMQVFMVMNNTPKSVSHIQHIHTGTSCPTKAADVNADGFVDVVEGVPTYGPILVNLDGDLNSFDAGSMNFPSSNGQGFFSYNEKASFNNFITDLQKPDTDPTDAIVKLAPGDPVDFASRHIVVHGVSSSINLPATVASLHGAPATATLPVACGKLARMTAAEEAIAKPIMDNAR